MLLQCAYICVYVCVWLFDHMRKREKVCVVVCRMGRERDDQTISNILPFLTLSLSFSFSLLFFPLSEV